MLMYAFARLRHDAFPLMNALIPEVASRAFEFMPQVSTHRLAEYAYVQCFGAPAWTEHRARSDDSVQFGCQLLNQTCPEEE